jgi:diguanylate cyclase (GGDEF)-like protein/PAS domain S-box-containing protein
MDFLDPKTLYLVYIVTSLISSGVLASLWYGNSKRFSELRLWLQASLFQNACLLLILPRGTIPAFFSIVLSNAFLLCGVIFLYRGLEIFTGTHSSPWVNRILFGLYLTFQVWFTYGYPSLHVRGIITPLAIAAVTARSAWLLFSIQERSTNAISRPTAIIVLLLFLSNCAHIWLNVTEAATSSIFRSGAANPVLILAYLGIYLALSLSLVLMVVNRTTMRLSESERKFFAAFKTAPYALAISDLQDGSLLDFNDSLQEMSGYRQEEMSEKSSLALNLWYSERDRNEVLRDILQGKTIKNREYLFRTKEGKILTCLFSTEFLELNERHCLISSISDITGRIAMENELRQNRTFLSEIIEHSASLICVKDPSGRYKLVNKKWEKATGKKREEVLGKTDPEIFPGDEGDQFRRSDTQALQGNGDYEVEEYMQTPKGLRYLLTNKFLLRDGAGSVTGICAMIYDITDRKRTEERIRHLANHDFLTDLPSMRLAKTLIVGLLERKDEHRDTGALLYLDLDGFKQVNDTCGHDAGDLVLQEIGRRLLSCKGPEDTVARIAGDEFMLIIPEASDEQIGIRTAERILESINKPIYFEDTMFHLGSSIGIAMFCCQDDAAELIDKADKAMYESKRRGKNRWTLAS